MDMIKKQCGKYEFNNYSKMISDVVEAAQNDYDTTKERQSQVDMELSDLLHYLEKDKLSACQMAKICSEIRKRRIERREINAKMCYLSKFISHLNSNTCKMAIGQLKIACNNYTYKEDSYVPRVLDVEKDILGGD